MAILKNIILGAVMAAALTSCYTNFEPGGKDSEPVLCMNSLITAGETIDVYLTHTWRYDDSEYYSASTSTNYYGMVEKLKVSDATVKLYINDQFVEDLTYTEWTEYDFTNAREQRGAFRSTTKPQAGDRVKIVANSRDYGAAEAQITMPMPVPIDKVDYTIEPNSTFVRSVAETEIGYYEYFSLAFKLKVYFTDPADRTDYYFVSSSTTVPEFDDWTKYNSNSNYGVLYFNTGKVRYDTEPLFSEHMSAIESVMAAAPWGCTFFTDSQISGKTYALNLVYGSAVYRATNYEANPDYYNVSFDSILYTITESYYKWLVYKWQDDDGLKGQLSDSGFGETLLGYSNVTTGAGVVVGRTPSIHKINLSTDLQQIHTASTH